MQDEITLKQVFDLLKSHEQKHGQFLSVIKGNEGENITLPSHAVQNVFNAHSCYVSVLIRVAEDMQAERPCNPTDLELIGIRKTHYERESREFYRSNNSTAWQA